MSSTLQSTHSKRSVDSAKVSASKKRSAAQKEYRDDVYSDNGTPLFDFVIKRPSAKRSVEQLVYADIGGVRHIFKAPLSKNKHNPMVVCANYGGTRFTYRVRPYVPTAETSTLVDNVSTEQVVSPACASFSRELVSVEPAPQDVPRIYTPPSYEVLYVPPVLPAVVKYPITMLIRRVIAELDAEHAAKRAVAGLEADKVPASERQPN